MNTQRFLEALDMFGFILYVLFLFGMSVCAVLLGVFLIYSAVGYSWTIATLATLIALFAYCYIKAG